MSFKPPKGQSCANCACLDAHPEWKIGTDGYCLIAPPAADEEEPLMVLLQDWCGHWRGNASVRCGGCKHFQDMECPRETWGPPDSEEEPFAVAPEAFACERYEEE